MSGTSFPTRYGELYGGLPCLDFANTLDGRATANAIELLPAWPDLVDWSHYAGLTGPSTAQRLTAAPPAAAGAVFATAIELREAIFEVFAAIAHDHPVPGGSLALLQARYAEATTQARLAPGATAFTWQYDGDTPGRVWWPVAISAVHLLLTGPLDRVKLCAAEAGCRGLFLDVSKNHSRRWCGEGCSLEAKIQRQAHRRRSARTETARVP
ncbi:ABATE domain-containing protein [Actinoplanes sp. TFC3]|uniref:CGNR zinc finger domain-containing protein n=1 Tax=Actinoplanes sp. TFC3 TaxID=1710355 RepID=UPI00082E761A|nr:CGNR zinc finger domain-containing protein [Actinoplanes sp. TFC3]